MNGVQLVENRGRYEWRGPYDSQHLPKSAGFHWDPAAKVWFTTSEVRASRLRGYADNDLRRSLRHTGEPEYNLEDSHATNANINVPAPMGMDYLPFQKAGIAYAMERKVTLIADEMGLGKTVQALGVINAIHTIDRVLIVCPASLKLNWEREFERWIMHQHRRLRVKIVGPGIKWPTEKQADVVIVNYETLVRHVREAQAQAWGLLIADEAHYVKTPSAQRSKALFAVQKKADRTIFLTGTPILNRPAEIYPLLRCSDPERWKNWRWFMQRYCGGTNTAYGFEAKGATNLNELNGILRASFMVRRLKKDVLAELPPKQRQIIPLEPPATVKPLLAEEHVLYERMSAAVANARSTRDKAQQDSDGYAEAVEKLRDARAAAFGELSAMRQRVALAKVPVAIPLIENALNDTDKLVVFAHHQEVLRQLEERFHDICVTITGDTPQGERQKLVDRFQSDPKAKLFLGSLMAAGVGLTLTAASHVIFIELDWVPANITQAEDRLHRIGQTNSVTVQHLVFDGSLDANMAKTLIAKQAITDAALN